MQSPFFYALFMVRTLTKFVFIVYSVIRASMQRSKEAKKHKSEKAHRYKTSGREGAPVTTMYKES